MRRRFGAEADACMQQLELCWISQSSWVSSKWPPLVTTGPHLPAWTPRDGASKARSAAWAAQEHQEA